MKQKIVIKLCMDGNDQRSRTKAFKIAVSQPGVESAAMQGSKNYELQVLGEQIDAVILTNSLRKKLGQAQLVSVGPVDDADNKNTNSDTRSEASATVPQSPAYSYPVYAVPQYPVYEVRDSNLECCSIM
ncbi:PREDICTED: heavy metal-associated isoprenylated plant protein 16-like [Nicotiana attenuata]|nr:PREDICTED: heavy metal-associated isoprenylated plant protein 16-like [Nicotiana attenuata]